MVFYENRPKLRIPKTILERAFDLLSVVFFIGSVGYLMLQWMSIPETVPIHFNAAGEPDEWGNKNNLWILLVIGSLMWILLSILEKFPHVYNYLFLTEENVERQYKNARLMLNVIKNEILIFFTYMSWVSTRVAMGDADGIGLWILPALIIVITGSIVFFIVRSIKLK
ncbi:DUF1648 domain-containing protein [Fictibacillus nanhaiensis]|uniref:DUF1648 domain-containing protein n=1 Tax=Fictibacillus nanhaiensis TaxID=742169 RepID=UPI001C98DCD8|nr:DUF1648 domain-containing protein [Fictibacillus nanhaiensis]MBY6037248.1 DUF1648 domain-containing protein [Fictibacillus nanhaiensis]